MYYNNLFSRALAGIVIFGAMLAPLSANPLGNPNFEVGSGSSSSSSVGYFATPAWNGWNNTPTLTTVEILPTTLPLASAGSQMLHIQSAGDNNGIYDFFGGGSYYAGAWFYVRSGSAYLWLVDGTLTKAYTAHQNQWEYVQYNSPIGTNEITVYTGVGGGDFFVDLVEVGSTPITPEQLPHTGVPEPASAGLAILGIAGLALARKRRNK